MKNDSLATDDAGMPPIPTFGFERKDRTETIVQQANDSAIPPPADEVDSEQSTSSQEEASSNPKFTKPQKTRKKKAEGQGSGVAVSHPVTFSTELRRSIQTDLAIISLERKLSGRKDSSIKQLLHEAFTLWLESPEVTESQKEKKLKLMQFPEQDPEDAFSNRIGSDLKRKLAKLKFDREGIQHSVRTIAAFTEEALINWIPLQLEFSVEEREKRLTQKAA